ncbi:MAG TPA: hypothetical protein VLZ83_10975 [Edaphocola sp.]|nr:hypothetical protein [Edaphocola sp.]
MACPERSRRDPQVGRFLGIDPLADGGGQQVLSPYHAMGCNPAMMIDPLGLQGQTSMSTPGNDHFIMPVGYMVEGTYVYLSADRFNKSVRDNFASYSLKAETEAFILKNEVLYSILEGLEIGSTVHNRGRGNYQFYFDQFGFKNGELSYGQVERGKRYIYKDLSSTIQLLSFTINISERDGTYGSGMDYGQQVSGLQSNGGGYSWNDFSGDASKANWSIGLGAIGLQNSSSTYRLYSQGYGFSPWVYSKNYPASPYFNRYSLSKVGTGLGRGLVGAAIAVDYVSYRRGEISGGKFGFNTGMGLYGLTGVGTIPSVLYFGVDAFYPGGWFGNESGPGALPVLDRIQRANQEILGPNWRILPYNKQ